MINFDPVLSGVIMLNLGTYFSSTLYSPTIHFFRGCKNVPATSATSYLVPLFILIYFVLFHLILPYNLDIPSYFTNRLRYCAAWPERDRTLYRYAYILLVFMGVN